MGVAIQVRFFQSATGDTPALNFIRNELTAEERVIVGADLRAAQDDWNPGPPLTDGFGKGLWEIRSKTPTRQIRLMVCVHDKVLVVLHAFIKKTRATPAADVKIARDRMKLL